jgi:iron complex outermembrane receptor protein
MRFATLFATAAIGPFLSTAALAQDAAATDGSDGDDIVVTAQRREERLQDVPISVAVANAAQMERSGVSKLEDLNAIVPGLNISHGIGSFTPSIRGISTSSTYVENPVALYIDGVYLPQQREGLRDTFDAEQITVLKGPQGTLFGRNATAGIIQITTRGPSFTPKGIVSAGIDDYSTIKANAFITGGLSETIAASLSASYASQGEGWGKSLASKREVYKLNHSLSLRGKLLFEPSDDTSFTLAADYLDRKDTGTILRPYPGTSFSYPGFGATRSRYDTYSGRDGENSFEGYGISLTAKHDMGFAEVMSITAFRKNDAVIAFDFDSTAADLIYSRGDAPSKSFSQEIQLLSPGNGPFKWVAGAFYFHNENALQPFTRFFGGPFVRPPALATELSTFSREKADSFAPFAQFDWEFMQGTTLTGGFRYTWERRTVEGFTRTVTASGSVTDVPSNQPKLTAKEPTWRVALSHKFADDTLIYASYNRGFKSGGFNIATLTNPGYLPEKLDAYEVGLKTALLDNALQLNLSSFYYDYQNLQVATFVGITQVTTNGAAAKLYGLDFDFRARLSERLRLSGAVAVMDTKFTDYPTAVIGSPNSAGGVILASGSAKGNRIPLAQEFVGTLAVDYNIPVGGAEVDLNVTATYNGDYYFEADNFLRQDDYVQLNASINVALPDKRTSVIFSATNLLDEGVIARNFTQAFGYFVNYSKAPRTFSAAVKYQF